MRPSGKTSGLKGRLWISGLGVIVGGLLVLLMVLATACDDAVPSATAEPTPSTAAKVADVEVVYVSRERQPPLLRPGHYDPLWGDIGGDEPIIDRLLSAIEGGSPVEIEEEGTLLSNIPLVINVRFRDGTTWSVRQATRCLLDAEGSPRNCRDVPHHWHLLHSDEMIVSTALTEWFERVHEYMPEVEYIEFPDPITPGEPFTISGAGFHEGDRVQLSIHLSDESVLALAEVPLKYGSFGWDGEIPETAPTGPGKVGMQVLDSTEIIWGVTVSTTVAAATAVDTATPPQTRLSAEYSIDDLAAWYESLKEAIWDVPGVWSTNLSEKKNRIEIGLRPLRGGRDQLETVLASLDVPREAIVVEVGCEGIGQWPRDPGDSPDEQFLRAVELSLEVVSQVAYGETVHMKLTLRNATNAPLRLALGGVPAYDFVVAKSNGDRIWRWKCGRITQQVLDNRTLEPGEELEFIGDWEQVDNQGEPVSPGVYLVSGVVEAGRPNSGPPGVVVTTAQELEVLR